MIEDLITQLIAALDRNTAAHGGAKSDTAASEPKKTRGKAATAPTAGNDAPPAEAPPATEKPAEPAAATLTKEDLVKAAEALRDAHGPEHIRAVLAANGLEGGRVSATAGTPKAEAVYKALVAKKAELDKAKAADPV